MWHPGFPFAEVRRARLYGYHRSLCILSIRNRGTQDRPGLALGLNRGGSCIGYAFRVPAVHVEEAWAVLWEREMPNLVYHAHVRRVQGLEGESVEALVFVARTDHPQYVGDMAPEKAARLVAQGRGSYGTSLDYLRNIVRELDALGIPDHLLRHILALAETRSPNSPTTEPSEA